MLDGYARVPLATGLGFGKTRELGRPVAFLVLGHLGGKRRDDSQAKGTRFLPQLAALAHGVVANGDGFSRRNVKVLCRPLVEDDFVVGQVVGQEFRLHRVNGTNHGIRNEGGGIGVLISFRDGVHEVGENPRGLCGRCFPCTVQGIAQENLPGPHTPSRLVPQFLNGNARVSQSPSFVKGCIGLLGGNGFAVRIPEEQEIRESRLARYLVEVSEHAFLQSLQRNE